MGQNKRYFWLKLFDDFFSSKRIKKLRSIAGGDTYTIIYLKMQLKALKTEGYLYFDGVMNDFAEELALDIDENPEDVKVTIQYLLSVGLIECSESGEEWFLTYMQNCIGSETTSAQRGREYRASLTDEQKAKERERARIGMAKIRAERKKNEDVTACYERVTNVEIEKEKEIDKDINISSKDDCTSSEEEPPSTYVYQHIVDLWNTLNDCGIPKIRSIPKDSPRVPMLRKRLKEYGDDSFKQIIDEIKNSDFLQGKTQSRGREPFNIDFDWVIKPKNYPKILEGKYRNKDTFSAPDVESEGVYNPRTGQTRIGQ